MMPSQSAGLPSTVSCVLPRCFLLLVLCLLASCGDDGPSAGTSGTNSVPLQAEPRDDVPFRKLVEHWAARSDAERGLEALDFAVGLESGIGQKHDRCFIFFAEMLVHLDQLDLLLLLEDRIVSRDPSSGPEKRWLLHAALYNDRGRPLVVATMSELAPRRLDSMLLAPWREGGLQDLLAILQDKGRETEDRWEAADLMGWHGAPELIPYLVPLREDATVYYPDSHLSWGKAVTIGEKVASTIKLIKRRHGG